MYPSTTFLSRKAQYTLDKSSVPSRINITYNPQSRGEKQGHSLGRSRWCIYISPPQSTLQVMRNGDLAAVFGLACLDCHQYGEAAGGIGNLGPCPERNIFYVTAPNLGFWNTWWGYIGWLKIKGWILMGVSHAKAINWPGFMTGIKTIVFAFRLQLDLN